MNAEEYRFLKMGGIRFPTKDDLKAINDHRWEGVPSCVEDNVGSLANMIRSIPPDRLTEEDREGFKAAAQKWVTAYPNIPSSVREALRPYLE
jgi:hypothetical protein